jgi:hypothetical protein
VTATTSLLTAEIDPNSVRPGWVALLIVLALGAATVLLWRNMGKQLKKIDFDGDPDDAGDQAPSAGPVSTDSSAPPAGDAEPMDTAPKPTESDPKEHSQH